MSQTPTVPPMVTNIMKFVLRSPLHGMVSKTVLLITFTGRKSGKTYTTRWTTPKPAIRSPFFRMQTGGKTYVAAHRSRCASAAGIFKGWRNRSPRINKPSLPVWRHIYARCQATLSIMG